MANEGITKSAILLMSLGEDEAAAVFKHLGPREVQKIGEAMASLKGVSRDAISSVIDEFCVHAEEAPLALGTDDYVRNVLKKALGDDRSAGLINRILRSGSSSGIENLKWMDASTVAGLIRNEHPQIIATVLVHLERDQASEIVALLDTAIRQDVIHRIATLDRIQPAALQELNEVLNNLLAGSAVAGAEVGGIHTAAQILNMMPPTHGTAVLDALKETDADLAQKLMDEMFTWENLLDLGDQAIQLLLREVQSEGLILALKGSSQAIRDKIFNNMSQRAGDMLKEDLEAKGMVRVSEVEAQQKEILGVVRRLAEEGQISLGAGGEAYV